MLFYLWTVSNSRKCIISISWYKITYTMIEGFIHITLPYLTVFGTGHKKGCKSCKQFSVKYFIPFITGKMNVMVWGKRCWNSHPETTFPLANVLHVVLSKTLKWVLSVPNVGRNPDTNPRFSLSFILFNPPDISPPAARFQIMPTSCVKTLRVPSAWFHAPPSLTWLRPSGLLVECRSTR